VGGLPVWARVFFFFLVGVWWIREGTDGERKGGNARRNSNVVSFFRSVVTTVGHNDGLWVLQANWRM